MSVCRKHARGGSGAREGVELERRQEMGTRGQSRDWDMEERPECGWSPGGRVAGMAEGERNRVVSKAENQVKGERLVRGRAGRGKNSHGGGTWRAGGQRERRWSAGLSIRGG